MGLGKIRNPHKTSQGGSIFPGGKNTTALTSPPKERIRKGQRNSQEFPLPLVMPFLTIFFKCLTM